MANPSRPAALDGHPHVTDAHRAVYDRVRELAVLQSAGWPNQEHSQAYETHPAAPYLMDQMTEWGVWQGVTYGVLGTKYAWEDYELILWG
jgi:hypothetical protein